MNQWLSGGREGLPVPIETAEETERSRDGESEVSSERAKGRMPRASVRRDGTGNPDLLGVTAVTC
jgi:hypothetical protein